MNIEENTLIRKSADLLEAPMDDSLALMSIESGKYFGLNAVGRAIWELLEQPTSFQDIISSLMNRFDIDERSCKDQCKNFLKELMQRKMIELN